MSSGPQYAQDNPEWAASCTQVATQVKLDEPRSLFIANTAIEFLKKSQGQDVIAAIAGGYARDKYYGKQPKDVDVVTCTGCAGYDYDFSELQDLVLHLRPLFPDCMFNCYEAYGQNTDSERVSCVLKIESNTGVSVDVIWYYNANDVTEILSQFDYNLNQFAIIGSPLNQPWYFGNLPHPNDELTRLRGDSSPLRDIKMKELYRQLIPNGVIND